MANFVRNMLREARHALNYQGYRIRTGTIDPEEEADAIIPGLNDDLPSPLNFGDEEFNAFCVSNGLIYRLDTTANREGTSGVDAAEGTSAFGDDQLPHLVRVSKLDDRYYAATGYYVGNEDNEYVQRDEGILATRKYVYVLWWTSGNEQKIWQIRKSDHRLRLVTSSTFRNGMVYDLDSEEVFVLARSQSTPTFVSGVGSWNRAEVHEIWRLDEDLNRLTQLESAGGGLIRFVMGANSGFNSGDFDTDRQHLAVGRVWYVKDGRAWNSWMVRSRLDTERVWWLGVAAWRWEDLQLFEVNGTLAAQYVDLVRGTANPEVEVGSDIGWEYGVNAGLDEIPHYRTFSFCLDENGVGWFSYLHANEGESLNEEYDDSSILSTNLVRYNFNFDQPRLVSSFIYRWGEPGGYLFEYQKPSSQPSTRQQIGIVACQRGVVEAGEEVFDAELGEYTVTEIGASSATDTNWGISWDRGAEESRTDDLSRSLVFYVASDDYDDLDVGSYDYEVQYRDEFGGASIRVRITISLEDDSGVAPSFINQPYTGTLAAGESERTLVFNVTAIGADSYRFSVDGNPGNLFDIDATSGEVYWRGTVGADASIPNGFYGLTIEAVNHGPTVSQDITDATFARVFVEDPDAYRAPRWNDDWVPVGYQRVGTRIENIADFTDGFYRTVNIANGIQAGSVPISEYTFSASGSDASIGDVVWSANSPIMSFVGFASGTADFTITVSDGRTDVALITFRLSWVMPSLQPTSLRWVQGHMQTASAGSIGLPVLEGSGRREVLTTGAEQMWVDVGARRRDLTLFVQQGADIVSVLLGAEQSWDVGGVEHHFRRVHFWSNGSNLDFETSPTARAVIAAVTTQEHIADTDYAPATSVLTVNINVGDNPIDVEPQPGYIPLQPNPAWRPLPVSPSAWQQHGAHTWRIDSETGPGGSVRVELAQSVVAGTLSAISWSVDVIRPDLGSYALSGSRITMNGQFPGPVTYQVFASDGMTTIGVVDLHVNYAAAPAELSQLRIYRGASTVPTLALNVAEGSEETEVGGDAFAVVSLGFNDREIRASSDLATYLRVVVGPEDETRPGAREGKRLHLFTDGAFVVEGETYTANVTANIDSIEVGGTTWSASSALMPVTITGTAAASQQTRFRFFGGQDRRELDAIVFANPIIEDAAEVEVTFGHGGGLYVWCSEIDAPRVISVASDRANVRAEVAQEGTNLGFTVDGAPNTVLRVHRVRVWASGVGERSPNLQPGHLTFTTPEVTVEGVEWTAGQRPLGFSGTVLPDF